MPRIRPGMLAAACALAAWPLAVPAVPLPAVAGTIPDAIPVEFVRVTMSEDIIQFSLTGIIEAEDSVGAGFREGGRLIEVLVSEGEMILRQQPLARIDPLQQQQALRVAEAALSAAQAREAVARQSADRAGAMLDRGIGTRAAHDAAVESLTAASTAIEQAITDVDLARRMLADTTLLAPFDGVVTQRLADPGQIVSPAQAVMRVARTDSLRAVFQIPDDPRLTGAMGAPVTLYPIDHPEAGMHARVTEIAPLIGPTTGSVEIHAMIASSDADMSRLGAPVRGSLAFGGGEGIWLPARTLMRQGGAPAVWVIGADHRVTLRPIEVQRYDTTGICVTSGLQPGEYVVGAGAQLVFPGREVRPAAMVTGPSASHPAGAGADLASLDRAGPGAADAAPSDPDAAIPAPDGNPVAPGEDGLPAGDAF